MRQCRLCCLLYLVSAAILTHSQNDSCQLDGHVRLRGGTENHKGRVELCRGSVWGTICDDDWDEYDAAVVCRQLGFQETDAIRTRNSAFQQGNGTIHEIKYYCTGEESSLIQCASQHEQCRHDEEAGVICNRAPCSDGDIQLMGGSSENNGRVEVCLNQQWTSVGDDNWSRQDAGVVCKQLGYTRSGATPTISTNLTFRPRRLQFVNCTGEESKLVDCSVTASQSLLAPDINTVPAVGVYCLNITIATSTGSTDTHTTTGTTDTHPHTTPILTTDFSVGGKISPWIATGVCIGLSLGIILLLLLCLLAIYCSRSRNSRQHPSQCLPNPGEDNIKLNNNESYACPPLPVGGPLEERENPCYEQILPIIRLAEENPHYGNSISFRNGITYENFHEVSANK